MKNIMRKVLALGVAAAMMLSTATAFAADGMDVSTTAPKSKASVQSVIDKTGSEDDAISGVTAKPHFGKALKGVKTLKTTSNPAQVMRYQKVPIGVELDKLTKVLSLKKAPYNANSSGYYHIFPFSTSTSGKMYFFLCPNNDSSVTAPVTVAFGTWSGNVFNISTSLSFTQNDAAFSFGGVDVVPGKTYYLGISSEQDGEMIIGSYVYTHVQRTLPQNTVMYTSGVKGSNNADSAAIYKIVPNKTGYIDVGLKAEGYSKTSGKVTLLNSKKKVVSSTLPFYTDSNTSYVVFGVKKGATYYLKVTGCKGTANQLYVYGIAYQATKGKIRANTKRSKSIKLKRKAKYTVTTAPAKTKGGKDWYKFKVTKKRKTQVRVDATNVKSGTIKATCYAGKKKIATKIVVKGKVNTFTITHSTTYGKANKGTYYFVIQKSAKMNGQYRIRYLK